MKNVNVLQLIASLCLLLGNVINLWNLREELPFAVSILAVPLLLASVVLYAIVLQNASKRKSRTSNGGNNKSILRFKRPKRTAHAVPFVLGLPSGFFAMKSTPQSCASTIYPHI